MSWPHIIHILRHYRGLVVLDNSMSAYFRRLKTSHFEAKKHVTVPGRGDKESYKAAAIRKTTLEESIKHERKRSSWTPDRSPARHPEHLCHRIGIGRVFDNQISGDDALVSPR